jgi:putative alpha-1,2-mannosidase
MSAWYVWSALGMFPETPGTPTLALGSPMFTQAVSPCRPATP